MIMRNIFVLAFQVFIAASAWSASFIELVDADQYESAAKLIDTVDENDPEIARRLGVMYYKGLGVAQDKAKGIRLLEKAMLRGDAIASINLVKIYYKSESNLPKAAWCLMSAEAINDALVRSDVEKMKNIFGDRYYRNLIIYIANLRDDLAESRTSLEDCSLDIMRLKSVNRELESKINDSLKLSSELEEQIESITLQLKSMTNHANELESELNDCKAELVAKVNDIAELNSAIDTMSAEHKELQKNYDTLLKKGAESEAQYNALSAKHQALSGTTSKKIGELKKENSTLKENLHAVEERNEHLIVLCEEMVYNYNSLALKHGEKFRYEYDDEQDDLMYYTKDESSWTGVKRGALTLIQSPCNFLRAAPRCKSFFDETARHDGVDGACIMTIFAAPFLFAFEAVPVSLDVFNGCVDVVTLGAYGDWLYEGNLTPLWYERDNAHFPWINKK